MGSAAAAAICVVELECVLWAGSACVAHDSRALVQTWEKRKKDYHYLQGSWLPSLSLPLPPQRNPFTRNLQSYFILKPRNRSLSLQRHPLAHRSPMGNWCSNPQDGDDYDVISEFDEWEVQMIVTTSRWSSSPSPYVCTRCGAEWHRMLAG